MVKCLNKIKSSEFGMKVLEKILPITKNDSATISHFKQAMIRFNECDTKKDASRIREGIQICKKYWKCYPYHYYICDLYRDDKTLTNKELIDYIPPFYWYYLFLPHHNSPKFSMIGENKMVMELFFKASKIIQQRNSSILFNGHLYSSDMEQLSFHRVQNELTYNNFEKIFVKPLEGGGGKGIYIFHKNSQGHFVTRDNIHFNEFFLGKIGEKQDYIIQPGIIQDPEISKIYHHSVNTCRIITENKNGTVRLVCAMLRMGRGQNEVDNATSGGISTHININSGKFGDFAISYDGEKFAKHPDTQFEFSNQGISRWNDIKTYTSESAGKLPFFTYLGWDIALTSDGPVAIEINRSPAADIMEKTSHGLREEFGIENPDYYWKNLGKRSEHFA